MSLVKGIRAENHFDEGQEFLRATGGYSAAYHAYLWAEMFDDDA